MDKPEIIKLFRQAAMPHSEYDENDPIPDDLAEIVVRFYGMVCSVEQEKVREELNSVEKWKGIALAKFGDGRAVQQVEAEARESERNECADDAEWFLSTKPIANTCAFYIRNKYKKVRID